MYLDAASEPKKMNENAEIKKVDDKTQIINKKTKNKKTIVPVNEKESSAKNMLDDVN